MKTICIRCANAARLIAALIATSAAASESPKFSDQRLPNIILNTFAEQITNRQRWPISITTVSDASTNHCRAEMSVRGSSSANREKKPYRLELQDENGDDLKLSLLGMPKESDWVLYPAYTDKTMIRDVLAYELWRQMGYWAPRTRYVHLFIITNSSSSSSSFSSSNESSSLSSLPSVKGSSVSSNDFASIRVFSGQSASFPSVKNSGLNSNFASFSEFSGDTPGYEGVYILMEKIKRGKNRINIQKLPRAPPTGSTGDPPVPVGDPPTGSHLTDPSVASADLSGGYIFKKDRHNNTNETHFHTSKKIGLIIEEPKAKDITPQQQAYLTNYINEFEAVLFSDYFSDPTIGYTRYVDIDSFVDYHWMQELSKNGDGYWWSEFYTKDRGGKIKIGPIWDCDLYFGNTWYNDGYKTNDWRWERSAGTHYTWYKRMFKDPDFLQRYIDRWSELRTNVLSNSNVLGLIDRFAAEISEAQKLNYQRWPTLGTKVGPVYFVGQTWEEEVQWLKDWMAGRLAWIDSQDFPKPVFQVIPPLLSSSSLPSFPSVETNSAFRAPHSALHSSNNPSIHPSSGVLSRPFASFAGSSLSSFPSVETNSASTSAPSVSSCSTLLQMSCDPAAGSIFYTTNNSDPRVPGGHASTNAIPYTSPIPIHPGLAVRARVLSEFGLWSAPALYP